MSRITVRRTIEELCAQGVLVKRQGKGTFVEAPRIYRKIENDNNMSFSAACRANGRRPSSHIISCTVSDAENWQNEFTVAPSAEGKSSAYVCAISVYSPERNEWIKKSDGSGATDIEPVKGGLSGALKRAASVLGIGRYLYSLEGKWVDIKPRGSSFVIQESEYKDLAVHYNQQMSARKKAQKAGNAPAEPLETNAAPKAAEKPQENTTGIKFRVVKSVVRNGAKGTQTALTLETPQNQLITGYMQGNPELRDGQIICNVKIEERESATIGKYNIIRGFEKAA